MNKRIEGSFANPDRLQEEIQRFLNQGFSADQLTILTRQDGVRRQLKDSSIPIVITSDGNADETFWDRIVSFFTVELDEEEQDEEEKDGLNERVDEEDVFEEFGIARSTYQRFEEALDAGEYLLLVDEAVPSQQRASDFLVRDGIIEEEEISMDEMKKDQERKTAKPDWTATDATKGDVHAHSAHAEKGAGKGGVNPDAAIPHGAHPDPDPGETEGNHVQANIPQSEHPDPEVDEHGNEIVGYNKEGHHPGEAFDKKKAQSTGESAGGESRLKYSRDDSQPQLHDHADRVSTDPFGGDPKEVSKGEGGENTEPEYDDSDHTPPAL